MPENSFVGDPDAGEPGTLSGRSPQACGLMTLMGIGIRCHDLLESAPRGYCIVEAELQDQQGAIIVQGEKNPYTRGLFVWGQIDPKTKLQTNRFYPSRQLTALAEALKALFDTLEPLPVERPENPESQTSGGVANTK